MPIILRLCTAILLTALGILFAASSAVAKDNEPVSGIFKGNGKQAKLAYVSAHKGDPFDNKTTTILVFTEQDHSKEKKPEIKAGFGNFGSALIITINSEGKIIGCIVAHAAHEKSGFNSLGNIKMSDFKRAEGNLQGKIATNGEQKFFGETWEVNISFQATAP